MTLDAPVARFVIGFLRLADLRLDAGAVVLASVLALIAGVALRDWTALDAAARDATIAYLLTLGLLTGLRLGEFGLPTPLSLGFWLTVVLTFLAYTLAIAAVFTVKRLFIR